MKFIEISLLFGARITVIWSRVCSIKALISSMIIKYGQTYNDKASNGRK